MTPSVLLPLTIALPFLASAAGLLLTRLSLTRRPTVTHTPSAAHNRAAVTRPGTHPTPASGTGTSPDSPSGSGSHPANHSGSGSRPAFARRANNRTAHRRAAAIAITATAASAVLAAWLAWQQGLTFFAQLEGGTAQSPVLTADYGTIETGGIPISLTLQADALSTVLGILVTVVALAVQIYSVGYLKDDARYPSYSAFVSLFTSAMLLVVFSGDLLVLYVGWEIMGICSYLLVGHWWEDRGNSRAAIKAFLVTRLGDVGFLFGIFVLGTATGSFKIADVLAKVPELSTGTAIAATLLLLAGVAGKSAQVPLHTWLPDAMAGPTPISALIHAATMVAAGIFVVARLFPVFLAAPPTLDVLAVLAALGMLGAALAALAQDDLKRVLAYSTISQLAFMAAALAAGSSTTAIFHLITHGAFKALLFLCAGVVIHHVGSNLMSEMGGLRKELPVTFVTMTVGFAALMGLPPTSGFFSKDSVLHTIEQSLSGGVLTDAAAWLLYGCALATLIVTGAYATRAWLRTFLGPPRLVELAEPPPGTAHVIDVREAPLSMLLPVMLLAVPAMLLGLPAMGHLDLAIAAISVVLALLGGASIFAVWRIDPVSDPARVLGPFRAPCEQAFYLDTLYSVLFVRPVLALSRLVVRTDDHVVDGAVRESGRTAQGASGLLRLAQNGNVQLYVSGVLAGVLLIAVGAVMLT
ncbi:NADH-quinone oxidoreductase subunit L [Nonomuraea sp. NPDC050328]|uniref:NADH-quinone oxidoreductase subunit L n=1 Tax=Nonomuraea sp. NPDC050328 TaxID=3364361 RepID=UPI0037B15D24